MKMLPLLLSLLFSGCATLSSSQPLRLQCLAVSPAGPWGAISGLTLGGDTLYAVHDHNRKPPEILEIARFEDGATVSRRTPLTGFPGHLDLEGIATGESGGFWLVSEGNNLLLNVRPDGRISEVVHLPPEVRRHRRKAGFEGVAARGEGAGEQVVVAIQHSWRDDTPGQVKLARYHPHRRKWEFFRYPLDGHRTGLNGLSFLPDGTLLVLERDNRPLHKAEVKRIYRVKLPESATGVPLLRKQLFLDLMDHRLALLACGTNGKFEGLASAGANRLFLVADDDGDATARLLELSW